MILYCGSFRRIDRGDRVHRRRAEKIQRRNVLKLIKYKKHPDNLTRGASFM